MSNSVHKRDGVYKNRKFEYRNSKQTRKSNDETKPSILSHFFEFVSNFGPRTLAQVIFQYSHRVSYSECTLGNHVYYSRYLDILEISRGEFFRHLGATFLEWQEEDVIFPVIECRLRYKAPARYDDLLTIETWLTSMARIRLNFAYRILKQKTLLVEGETFHVCTGFDQKPKKLPQELVSLLEPYLHAN
jgi:acyl-CoA thioester hydrolase, YbgC/YbaW family